LPENNAKLKIRYETNRNKKINRNKRNNNMKLFDKSTIILLYIIVY